MWQIHKICIYRNLSTYGIGFKNSVRGFAVNSCIKRFLFIGFVAFLFVMFPVLPEIVPGKALALKIALQESSDHPKGVEIPPPDQMNPAEPVKEEKKGTPQQAQAAAPAKSSEKKPQAPTKEYSGVFKVLEPLKKVFPLKTGTVGLYGVNLLSDEAWSVNFSRYTGYGTYYLEGGKSIAFLKDFNAKFQQGKQLKNQLRSSQMMDMSAKVYKFDVKYSKKVNRNRAQGIDTAMSVADNRNFSVGYSPSNNLSIAWVMDSKASKSLNSASPTRTVNKRNDIKVKWKATEDLDVELSQSLSSNWNYNDDTVAKVRNTDIKLSFPLSQRMGMQLGYNFVGNRNLQAGSASDSETRKTTRYVGMDYAFNKDAKVSYRFDVSKDRNQSVDLLTNSDITSRDLNLKYTIFKWLKFNGQNKVAFSESAGKNAVRKGSFSIEHKNLSYLPGTTKVNIQKNLTKTGSNADPKTTSNYTLSVNTPLKYFKNMLSLSHNFNMSDRLEMTESDESRNRSVTHTYNGTIKLSSAMSIGTSLRNTNSIQNNLIAITSDSVNRTLTDKVTYLIKKPFTQKVGFAEKLNYTFSRTNSKSTTYIPTYSLTKTDVFKNQGVLALKGGAWNGNYTLEQTMSKPKGGINAKALMHKFVWNLNDIMGFKFTGNYSLTKQNDGSVSGGVFKMSKEQESKNLLTFLYEFSKNQKEEDRENNKLNRYFEAGLEMKF